MYLTAISDPALWFHPFLLLMMILKKISFFYCTLLSPRSKSENDEQICIDDWNAQLQTNARDRHCCTTPTSLPSSLQSSYHCHNDHSAPLICFYSLAFNHRSRYLKPSTELLSTAPTTQMFHDLIRPQQGSHKTQGPVLQCCTLVPTPGNTIWGP